MGVEKFRSVSQKPDDIVHEHISQQEMGCFLLEKLCYSTIISLEHILEH